MVEFSPIAKSRYIKMGDLAAFSAHDLDLAALGDFASPVVTLAQYRLTGRPFAPHVHVGFSAVAYVLEDSASPLRSRDCLGNDIRTDAGGVLWTQAASGAVHEDTTFYLDREMHGVQLFVNLGGEHKLLPPSVMRLPPDQVPVWESGTGDSVRVLCGSYAGLESPLRPAAPFTFLHGKIREQIKYDLPAGQNLVVFVLDAAVKISADGASHELQQAHAIGARGGPAKVTIAADQPAQVLIMIGTPIPGPVVRQRDAYIMSDKPSLDAAVARYERGEIGVLAPRVA